MGFLLGIVYTGRPVLTRFGILVLNYIRLYSEIGIFFPYNFTQFFHNLVRFESVAGEIHSTLGDESAMSS